MSSHELFRSAGLDIAPTSASSKITAGRENGRTRPKGYADWRPHGTTRAILDQVGEVLVEYDDHLPLSVRQIFYRLVATFDYEKTERAYARLAEYLVRARRAEVIPFNSIRDDGVVTDPRRWYDGIEDFANETARRAKTYKRDRQADQPYRVELWCEAAGMVPQLGLIGDDYSVPVYSAGGFASLTGVRMIVDRAVERDQSTVLLHVGDYDPSGESIFTAMAADAVAFFEKDKILASQTIIPVRVALTADQVDEYDLPTAPAKTTDSRSGSWTGETCQLEALAPDQLAEVVRAEISSWFVPERFADQIALEEDDRVELWRGLPRGSS